MFGKRSNEVRRRRLIANRGRAQFWTAVFLVFLAGLVARLLGLRLGLPYIHHWDECWIVWNAQKVLDAHARVPMTFQYGAPLSAMLAGAVKLYNLWPGAVPISVGDDVALRWSGRSISGVLGATGTLAMVIAGRNTGLHVASRSRLAVYAAVTYAMGYELVTHARYAVTDAALAAFAAWSMAAGAAFLTTRRLRWVLLSLAFATLAFGFKFTALPTIAIPVLCLIAVGKPIEGCSRWLRVALIVSAPLVAVAGFVLVNPHFVDSTRQAVSDLAQRMAQTRDGGFSHCYVHEPGLDHLRHLLWALAGHTLSRSVVLACILSAIAVFGIGWAVQRWSKIALIGTIHWMIVVVGLAVSVRTLVLRNYLTAVPLMCLGVGIGLERFRGWWLRRSRAGKARIFAFLPEALLTVLALATLRDSLANAAESKDSRERALEWVGRNAKGRTTVSTTPSVTLGLAGDAASHLRAWVGPNVQFVKLSQTCADLQREQPDYVIAASYRGPDSPAADFDERWYFTECSGYSKIASFDANPYECTFWVYPTWMGRVSTVVLQRVR